MRTLKSRLKAFGLRRRSLLFDEGETRARIQQELDGPGCMAGYRSIWHTLRHENFDVPRQAVANLLQEMDPEGCDTRRRRRLRRRVYVNQGPNHCWNIDGYDKLKPYGFQYTAVSMGSVEKCCGRGLMVICETKRNETKYFISFRYAKYQLPGPD